MANSALIDDLLKQFADNPRRVFARLANEYRKRGELDSAIEICRSHVPLQPGYISGHIVLGQALYDSGSLEEARSTFETALALDPENLIALRHMGDIARANGDVEKSRAWYRQLLEIDPQNEEVAAQLESLAAEGHAQDSAPGAASEEMGGWGEISPEAIDLTVVEDGAASKTAISETAISETTVSDDTAPDSTVAETTAGAGAAVESTPPAGDVPAADVPAADVPAADDALVLEEIFDFPESSEEEPAPDALPVSAVEGLEATSFQSEERAEVASLELVEIAELSSDTADTSESSEASSEATAETAPAQGAVAPLFPADSYDFADQDASDEGAAPSAFATETMAELYLQQGFPDRALAIYRDLAARDPDDSSLQERIAELTESEDAAPVPEASAKRARTAREFFGVLAYRRAPRADANEAAPLAEAVTEAESEQAEPPAAEHDAEVVATDGGAEPGPAGSAAEPPVAASDPGSDPASVETRSGTPGREAASALSLDDVFRDTPSSDGVGPRNGLSFDEFFARRGNGAAEHTNGTVAAESHENRTGEERAAADEPQDLELFHAWLDGLKG